MATSRRGTQYWMQFALTLALCLFMTVPVVLSVLAGLTNNIFVGLSSGLTTRWLLEVWSLYRGTIFLSLGIALACVMLSFLMMITRRKAIPQVIGFLSMENGLFFAATSATYGMPMVVELGIALDVLVGVLILGVFFFQIREQFDSLDLKHLENLRETDE